VTATRELVFPDAVAEVADLFDRDPQVDQVRRVLRGPARRTVVLLGGRLAGKTSLLNVVAHWAEAEASYAVIRLAYVDSRDEFMAEIGHGIYQRVGAGRAATRELFGPDGTFRTGTVARFVRDLQGLTARAPDLRFLLCVDELDNLLQGCGEETARQILNLVLHLTEHSKLPIRFLFTMSRIPEQVRHSYGSPFLNQATIVELRPWSAEQAREFADWLLAGRLELDEAGHDGLYAAAGGHPYFTKAVLRSLLDRFPAGSAPARPAAAAVAAAAAAAVRSREVDIALSNLAGVYLPEGAVAVLDRAAGEPAGVTAAQLRDLPVLDDLLDTLTDTGLLARADQRYLLRLGMWRHWRGTRGRDRRPARLVRLARAVRWPGSRGVRTLVLFVLLLLLALAVGPELLLSSQPRTIYPCHGAAQGLRLTVSYPTLVSLGDEHELRVKVVNGDSSAEPIDGSVVVAFPASPPGEVDPGDNVLSLDQLQPAEQRSREVGFTVTQPGRLLPDTGARVPVALQTTVPGAACSTETLSLPVASLPYLRNLQRGALALLLLLPAPMLVEAVARRLSHRRPPAAGGG
jgi:hypothetical protein